MNQHPFIFKHIRNKAILLQAQKALGQLTHYAQLQFARQHRWACFQIFVVGTYARFLRWDRSGAIVSRRFNYREDPKPLYTFLWRYVHADSTTRGYYETVRSASDQEEELFKATIEQRLMDDAPFLVKGDQKEEDPRDIAKSHLDTYYAPGQVWRIKIENKEYLISRPVVSPVAIVSCGTRGYWAVTKADPKTKPKTKPRVVFLKDTWCYDVENMDREANIVTELNKKKIDHVPTITGHEFVQGKRY